jgi:hypothetical protein
VPFNIGIVDGDWNAACPFTWPMSGFRFSHNLNYFREDQKDIVIVTSKQYLAVADDFIRNLFPELTPERLPHPGPFTVFISDDVVH